jgi:aldehyde dehydrogenase (NAD+)
MVNAAAYKMLIDGTLVDGTSHFDVVNPATRQIVGKAPDCSAAQLDTAAAAARRAFKGWKATPLAERQAIVKAIGDRLGASADDLKGLLTEEQGKPHADAQTDILAGAYWCHSMAAMSPPVTINEDTETRRSETHHVPIGVVGAIAPWNFPITLAMWKVAPALVAGNCVVLKPSPFTPLTTLKIAELLADIVPAGVLNIVTGDDALGPLMTAHPGIDKISFTGSTQTGRKVMASASTNLKRVTLELGGNDAAIVLPDVDIEPTAEKLFWAAFTNAGQICVATKRLYIHEAIFDRMLAAMIAYAKTVKVGDGAKEGTQLGPIQNKQQYERVLGLIEDARARGYKLHETSAADAKNGYFVPVTFVENPPDDARIVVEEQFGPVLPVMRFTDIDEAVTRANASDYGLAGSVWSADISAAFELARQLDTGTVWINEALGLSPFSPFGGHKHSGIGAENGLTGLLEYTNPQTLFVPKA